MIYFIDVMTSSSVTVTTPSTSSLMTAQGSSLIVVSRASHIVSGGAGLGTILPEGEREEKEDGREKRGGRERGEREEGRERKRGEERGGEGEGERRGRRICKRTFFKRVSTIISSQWFGSYHLDAGLYRL